MWSDTPDRYEGTRVIFTDTEGTFGAPAAEWMGFFRDSEGNLVGVTSREPI